MWLKVAPLSRKQAEKYENEKQVKMVSSLSILADNER